ncbi:MAG: SIS domain-containing protein [Nitrososphaerales archaeon]
MRSLKGSQSFGATIVQIESQETDLHEYADYLSKVSPSDLEPDDAIFCGAGDSLACAIFIERLMNFKPRAFDPYDIMLYPEVLRGKKVYFISVSGRTRSNIEAAKLANRRGAITTSVTANPDGVLARTCSNTIKLKFTSTRELTPGTNSFTASLLACASLFKNLPKFNVRKMLDSARVWAERNADGSAYQFVGSGAFFGIAMYGAAKVSEFAGSPSSYQLTEEFSHMNLFAAGKEDSIVILRFGKDDQKAKLLDSLLTKAGFRSILLPTLEEEHVVVRALSYSIHLQYLALEVALQKKLERPAFLENRSVLRVSDKMIY